MEDRKENGEDQTARDRYTGLIVKNPEDRIIIISFYFSNQIMPKQHNEPNFKTNAGEMRRGILDPSLSSFERRPACILDVWDAPTHLTPTEFVGCPYETPRNCGMPLQNL